MKQYTNCELYHCSMERKEDANYIAKHLTISTYPKYTIIGYNIDICHFGCPLFDKCNENKEVKKAEVVKR